MAAYRIGGAGVDMWGGRNWAAFERYPLRGPEPHVCRHLVAAPTYDGGMWTGAIGAGSRSADD